VIVVIIVAALVVLLGASWWCDAIAQKRRPQLRAAMPEVLVRDVSARPTSVTWRPSNADWSSSRSIFDRVRSISAWDLSRGPARRS